MTMFLEDCPVGYEKMLDYFGVNKVYDKNPSTGVMVRSIELCKITPYDRTMWLDTDTVTVGKVDEMFDYLEHYEFAIPHFANWYSDGGIARRIKRYEGRCDDKILQKALERNPAINCGVFSFQKDSLFLNIWLDLALKGDHQMFIPDEVAFQTLYPSYNSVFIAPQKFNVSVRYDPDTQDKRIIHYHGQKHVQDYELCTLWKAAFKEMCDNNIAGINDFLGFADKRLARFIKGETPLADEKEYEENGDTEEKPASDVTIVTACDPYYVDLLRESFVNWRAYKNVDRFPIIVYVNGMELTDKRLDFLRLPTWLFLGLNGLL